MEILGYCIKTLDGNAKMRMQSKNGHKNVRAQLSQIKNNYPIRTKLR